MRLSVRERRSQLVARNAGGKGRSSEVVPVGRRQDGQSIPSEAEAAESPSAPTQNALPSEALLNQAPTPTTLVTSAVQAAPSKEPVLATKIAANPTPAEVLPAVSQTPEVVPEQRSPAEEPESAGPSQISEEPEAVSTPAPEPEVIQEPVADPTPAAEISEAAPVVVTPSDVPSAAPIPDTAVPTTAPDAPVVIPDTAVAAVSTVDPPSISETVPEITSAAPIETPGSAVPTEVPDVTLETSVLPIAAPTTSIAAPEAQTTDEPILSSVEATIADATPTEAASSTVLDADTSVAPVPAVAVQTSEAELPSATNSSTDEGTSVTDAAPAVATDSNSDAEGAATESATSDAGNGSSSADSQAATSAEPVEAPLPTASPSASGLIAAASLPNEPTAVSSNPESVTNVPGSVSNPLLSGTQSAASQTLVPVPAITKTGAISVQTPAQAVTAAAALQSESVGTGPNAGVILSSGVQTGIDAGATGVTGGTSTGKLEQTSGPLDSGAGIAGVVVGSTVGAIAFAVIIWFIIHRVFRKRRIGRKADSPPASPLLQGLNSPLPAGIARAMSQRSAASSGMGDNNFWASGQGAVMTSDAGKFSDKISMPMGSERSMGSMGHEKGYGPGFAGNNVGPAPLSPLPPLSDTGVNGMGGNNGGFSLFPQHSGASNEKRADGFPKDF